MRAVIRLAFAAALAAGCAASQPVERPQPNAVIALLGVDPGNVVWDLGAGDPSFTSLLAEAVGRSGRVVSADPGANGTVDLLFVNGAYHRIPERSAFFRDRVLAALVPNGRVAIVEGEASAEVIAQEMREAGYEQIASHEILTRQSFQIFRADDGTGE